MSVLVNGKTIRKRDH